jgi:UDP-glucose 4-epimerase
MKKVLVIGCAGFIGSHLARCLMGDGHEVWGVDNFVSGQRNRVIDGLNFVEGDISERNFKLPTEDFHAVFHVAAIPCVQISIDHPEKVLRNNIDSTIWALELCRRSGAKMIYSSSSSIYGEQDYYPVREDAKPNPQSPYALSKLMG